MKQWRHIFWELRSRGLGSSIPILIILYIEMKLGVYWCISIALCSSAWNIWHLTQTPPSVVLVINSQQNYLLCDCCADSLCGWLKWEFESMNLWEIKLSLSFLKASFVFSHRCKTFSRFSQFSDATMAF